MCLENPEALTCVTLTDQSLMSFTCAHVSIAGVVKQAEKPDNNYGIDGECRGTNVKVPF